MGHPKFCCLSPELVLYAVHDAGIGIGVAMLACRTRCRLSSLSLHACLPLVASLSLDTSVALCASLSLRAGLTLNAGVSLNASLSGLTGVAGLSLLA